MSQHALYSLYVLCIIVGCLVALFICYAIHHTATNGFEDDACVQEISPDQAQYMRNLRYRYRLELLKSVRG